MTIVTARYNGKVLVPDGPLDLPTGVPLRLTVELSPVPTETKPVWQMAVEIGGTVPDEEWARVPTDAARNLDHYLYGAPREPA